MNGAWHILTITVTAILLLPVAYITFTVLYNYFLTGAFLLIKEKKKAYGSQSKMFCIIIPAHNEELLLGRLLDSLNSIEYPRDKYEVIVIADNCDDCTAEIAGAKGVRTLLRRDRKLIGKGFALNWALERVSLDGCDAVLIIDADNIVDKDLLRELNASLCEGSEVIQCNNSLANPESSWLTRIMYIVRVMDNTLVHYAKQKLGYSSFLMGNGMCLSTSIMKRYRWTSFSLSEDFEYYSKLILKGVYVDFNYQAVIYHQESLSLGQAQSQRERWSAGKFELIRKYGLQLLLSGIRKMSFKAIDASFILLLPHPSLLFNISLVTLMLCYFLNSRLFLWVAVLILLQFLYFIIGLFISRASLKTVLSMFYAPVYLCWKGILDIICLFGTKKKAWKRTSRS